jgi:4-amino-4-deoxy-L-arabinose transferase-like glycosyltransferase
MSQKTITLCLSLFCLIALLNRVGTDVYLKAWKQPSAMEHRPIAMNLVHGLGFTFNDWNYQGPTSVQSPPFPFLLAGMYKIFGTDEPANGSLHGANRAYFAIMVMNAFASALLVWLTYTMTRTFGSTPLAGLIAAGLVAIWPTQIYAARFVQAVTFITCGLAGMIILYNRAMTTGKAAPWIFYSIVATLVALTEPVFLPALVLILGLMLITKSQPMSVRRRNLVIQCFAVFALIGPWATRNFIVHGKLIPVKGSFWVNVWKGNNPDATGSDRLPLTAADKKRLARETSGGGGDDIDDTHHVMDMLDPSQTTRLFGHSEAEREELFKIYATTWIKDNPGRFLQLCGIRLIKSLTIDWDNPRAYLSRTYQLSRAMILLFTIGGLFIAWRQKWQMQVPLILAFCALASYTLTVAAARFAFPFEPIQLALGGGFIAAFLPDPDRSRNSNQRGFEPVVRAAPSMAN